MAIRRKQHIPTLREIVRRIPKENDLFSEVFSRESVINAIDRLFVKRNMYGYSSWFVLECAGELSRQYSDLAAAMLERAADYILERDGLRSADECQNLVSEAATHWLMSDNIAEYNETNLHRISISLKSTKQRELFVSEEHLGSLIVLYDTAERYFESGNLERALETFQLFMREMEVEEQYVAAGDAALRCMLVCAALENWPKTQDFALESLELYKRSEEDMDLDDMLLCNYYTGKAMYFMAAAANAGSIIDCLTFCKEDDEDREMLTRNGVDFREMDQMLARCHAIRGELCFQKWAYQNNSTLLSDAEADLIKSAEMLEEEPERPRRVLARVYAALSTVYSAKGSIDEAAEYREKALRFGFDLSEE